MDIPEQKLKLLCVLAKAIDSMTLWIAYPEQQQHEKDLLDQLLFLEKVVKKLRAEGVVK